MCGRFTLYTDLRTLQARFGLDVVEAEVGRRYNIAPTQQVLTAREDGGERRGELMRWGLLPAWASPSPSPRASMINARGEDMAVKPAFRNAVARRRCLVIADGFYEWKREGRRRLPVYFTLKSGGPFAFAGLWERWQSPEGELVHSCAIVTTRPNALVAPIHDRMPAMLTPSLEDVWLDGAEQDPLALTALVAEPYRAEDMAARFVAPMVNSAGIDAPECIAPSGEAEEAGQGGLF